MKAIVVVILVHVIGFFASRVLAADDSPIIQAKVSKLIHQLDDDSFFLREDACKQLVQIGEPAAPALRKTMTQGSREVKWRARGVYRQLLGEGLVLFLPMNQRNAAPGIYRQGRIQPTKDQTGKANGAALFSGGRFLVPDSNSLDTDESFTLAAWIKPTTIQYIPWKEAQDPQQNAVYPWGQSNAFWAGHFIACKWHSSGIQGDYIFAITPSGRLGLGVSNSRPKFQSQAVFTEASLKPRHWVHVAGSFDHGELRLYLDGKIQCRKQFDAIKHTNRNEYRHDDIYVGGFWLQPAGRNAPDYHFHGCMNHFCLFNRELSEKEIQRLMRLTK